MVPYDRSSFKTGQIELKYTGGTNWDWSLMTDNPLTEVGAWAGLTVHVYVLETAITGQDTFTKAGRDLSLPNAYVPLYTLHTSDHSAILNQFPQNAIPYSIISSISANPVSCTVCLASICVLY